MCEAAAGSAAASHMQLMVFDHEGWLESYGSGQVVEIGRRRHHGLMDLGKLLLGAVTLDAHHVGQALVASLHGRIDAEESAQVDFASGLDSEALESDAAHGALRDIPDHYAGVERRDQVFLRIGILVRAAELARFVDVDRKRRGTSLPPMPKPSTSARLRVWPCHVVTTCHSVLPLEGSRLTPSIRANRSSTLMPLTTFGATVTALPFVVSLLSFAQLLKRRAIGLAQRGERCLNTLALAFRDQSRQHLAEIADGAPEWMYCQ